MNVQFGAGSNQLPNFENWDSDVDIAKDLPYKDSTVDFILCEHCLEHVDGPSGFHFMQECYRILKRDGILRICVPRLARISDRAHAADLVTGHGHKMVFCFESLRDMLWAAGFDRSAVMPTGRMEVDGHWKIIGREKDDVETLRVEVPK